MVVQMTYKLFSQLRHGERSDSKKKYTRSRNILFAILQVYTLANTNVLSLGGLGRD